ncbi:hypothetical protein IFM89_017439 [Coptis chinensis]|uniref:GCK domain-containing protein n=1 Tax=Coptis chinensis TaxID=261450 RepID=A0A835H3P7_9MAGN|nr:hypothetical protein IFM89_017439 [Coptis chinensis]
MEQNSLVDEFDEHKISPVETVLVGNRQENCLDANVVKEDIAEKCYQVTVALKTCMEAHPDYYEPILRAKKVAEQEAMKELEKEAELKDKYVEKELVEEPGQEAALEDK